MIRKKVYNNLFNNIIDLNNFQIMWKKSKLIYL